MTFIIESLKRLTQPKIKLTGDELSALAEKVEERNYNKGAQIISIGENELYVNFIIKGIARRYFYRGREEVNLSIAREGEFIFSTTSFFTGKPSGEVIATVDTTRLFSISKENLETLYKEHPRFESLGSILLMDAFIEKDRRYREWRSMSTRERFLKFIDENNELIQRVPQKILASYLEIQPETFSRLKHLLRNRSVMKE